MSVPLTQRIGRVITTVLLSSTLQRWSWSRRLYTFLYLIGKRMSERAECDFFARHIKPGMNIVDIGANVGFYTTRFALWTGRNGKVFSFEPDPLTAEILTRRTKKFSHVNISRVALGDHAGEVTLFCDTSNRAHNYIHPTQEEGSTAQSYVVPMITGDTWWNHAGKPRIDAIKMDTEGTETFILRGMKEWMHNAAPQWMVLEFSPALIRHAGSTPEEYWKLLESYGYDCFSLEGAKPTLITDTNQFTERIGESYVNVWAVRQKSA